HPRHVQVDEGERERSGLLQRRERLGPIGGLGNVLEADLAEHLLEDHPHRLRVVHDERPQRGSRPPSEKSGAHRRRRLATSPSISADADARRHTPPPPPPPPPP